MDLKLPYQFILGALKNTDVHSLLPGFIQQMDGIKLMPEGDDWAGKRGSEEEQEGRRQEDCSADRHLLFWSFICVFAFCSGSQGYKLWIYYSYSLHFTSSLPHMFTCISVWSRQCYFPLMLWLECSHSLLDWACLFPWVYSLTVSTLVHISRVDLLSGPPFLTPDTPSALLPSCSHEFPKLTSQLNCHLLSCPLSVGQSPKICISV